MQLTVWRFSQDEREIIKLRETTLTKLNQMKLWHWYVLGTGNYYSVGRLTYFSGFVLEKSVDCYKKENHYIKNYSYSEITRIKYFDKPNIKMCVPTNFYDYINNNGTWQF